VTAQMVANFAAGGAAINQLARAAGLELTVVPLDLERPTADFTQAPAMDEAECLSAMAAGAAVVEADLDLLVVGEMGIGNTTSAAALALLSFGGDAADWVGPGTGVDAEGIARKVTVIREAAALHGAATSAFERLRRVGETRLAGWLQRRRVRNYAAVAARAIAAARAQSVTLPGQEIAAAMIAELATNTLALDQRLTELDAQIAATLDEHPQAEIIQSMPGFGPILGATLLVAAGDLAAFPSAGHLAAAAGLVPVPNDSGRRTGNLHKPRRYNRPLRHVFYLSAQTSMMRDGPNRDYYLKKRDRGRTHTQAVIALARRRIDVLWALLRDERIYTAIPPTLAQAA